MNSWIAASRMIEASSWWGPVNTSVAKRLAIVGRYETKKADKLRSKPTPCCKAARLDRAVRIGLVF